MSVELLSLVIIPLQSLWGFSVNKYKTDLAVVKLCMQSGVCQFLCQWEKFRFGSYKTGMKITDDTYPAMRYDLFSVSLLAIITF